MILQIQHDWLNDTFHCFTPPDNWNIPIMCNIVVGGLNEDNDALYQTTYTNLSSCCPPVANGSNIWLYRRGCGPTCYTYDTVLAGQFNECVNHAGSNTSLTWNNTDGECEYIDYAALRKQDSGAERTGSVGGVLLLAGLMSLAVIGLNS